MSKLIVLILITFLSINLNAQDSLTCDKQSRSVFQNGELLNKADLVTTMRPNKDAFKHLESATDSYIFSNVLFGLCSFPLGYTVGYFLVSQEVPKIMFGVGLGLLTGGIVLNIRSKSQLQKSVDSYNSGLNLSASRKTPLELSFGINQHGVGFNLMF